MEIGIVSEEYAIVAPMAAGKQCVPAVIVAVLVALVNSVPKTVIVGFVPVLVLIAVRKSVVTVLVRLSVKLASQSSFVV